MKDNQFRFEGMEIWRRAAGISSQLFRLASELDQRRHYRFGEQLRSATLSITNNIAEGSGSVSKEEFAHFLNIARRSVFEVANILTLLTREEYWRNEDVPGLLAELAEQSRMLLAFRRTLKS